MVVIKKFSFMSIDGNIFKKIIKIVYYLLKRKSLSKKLSELNILSDLLFKKFPKIPLIQ